MIESKLERFYNQMRGSNLVVVDLETTGLDFHTDRIISFIFGFPDGNIYYFPVGHDSGNCLENPKPLIDFIRDQLSRQDITIVGHNLIFDLLFLRAMGTKPQGKLICTMVQYALLNEYAKSYSLKACGEAMGVKVKEGDQLYRFMADYFNEPYDESKKSQKGFMGRLKELPGDAEPLRVYAEGDVQSTWELYEAIQEKLVAQELTQVAGIESRSMAALLDMQYRGVRIDRRALDVAIGHTEEQVVDLRKQFPDGFQTKSSKQVLSQFTEAELDRVPSTAKGGKSFTKEVLAKFEVGQKILGLRQAEDFLAKFLIPIRDKFITEDDYIFPRYHQARNDDYGTVTGRLSSSDPNIQQIPKRDVERSKVIRGFFYPDEGYLWSSNDLNQCEYRLFAHYTKSETLIAGYSATPSVDMHTTICNQLGLDPKKERIIAKTLNFSILYGAGVDKIAETLKMPREQAAQLRADYYRTTPEVKEFMNLTSTVAQKRGYVKTILGRRCRFGIEEDKYYKAANRIIQGSNADYLKLKLAEIYEYFESEGEGRILATIHDSVEWQIPPGERGEKINAEALRIFSNEYDGLIKLRLPMGVEGGIGKNWAEAG